MHAIAALVLAAGLLSVPASASEYHSNLTDEEIRNIFSLEISDIPNAYQWITDADTFLLVEEHGDGAITYWWNTPNMQMTFYNMLYKVLSQSGYGNTAGRKPESKSVSGVGDDDAVNGMEKYGFNIMNPTYYGERPMITLSLMGVLTPDSIFDGFGRAWNFIWTGDVVSLPTDKDLDSLAYAAPRDYNVSGATFLNWVKEHWYDALPNIAENQVLLTTANQDDGMKDGKQWIAKNIIYDQGLAEPGLDADYICQQLEDICGRYYGQVAEGIIIASGVEEVHRYERIMPYDVTRMNSKDLQLMDGVIDPRSDMQENILSTGYANMFKSILAGSSLSSSGKLAEQAVALNQICSLDFFESRGWDPLVLWDSAIVQVMLVLMLCTFVALCVSSAVKMVSGRAGAAHVVVKIICTFLVCGFVWSFGSRPEESYNAVKGFSEVVFSLGNVTLDNEDGIQELYGNSNVAEKQNVNLWLPYFNVWTKYQTNHGLLDPEQLISTSSGPEMNNLEIPDIDGVQQNLWSTVLADACVNDSKSFSGNVYRMVDHFMAPRVQMNNLDTLDMKVTQNENWNGNIQNAVPAESILMQLLILLMVIIKVLIFLEFMFNFFLLVVRLSLSVFDTSQCLTVVKQLLASIVDVAAVNIALSLVVYSTISSSGFLTVFLAVFYGFLLFVILKELMLSNSVFAPRILQKPVLFVKNFIAGLFVPNGERYDNEEAIEAERQQQINGNGGDADAQEG